MKPAGYAKKRSNGGWLLLLSVVVKGFDSGGGNRGDPFAGGGKRGHFHLVASKSCLVAQMHQAARSGSKRLNFFLQRRGISLDPNHYEPTLPSYEFCQPATAEELRELDGYRKKSMGFPARSSGHDVARCVRGGGNEGPWCSVEGSRWGTC